MITLCVFSRRGISRSWILKNQWLLSLTGELKLDGKTDFVEKLFSCAACGLAYDYTHPVNLPSFRSAYVSTASPQTNYYKILKFLATIAQILMMSVFSDYHVFVLLTPLLERSGVSPSMSFNVYLWSPLTTRKAKCQIALKPHYQNQLFYGCLLNHLHLAHRTDRNLRQPVAFVLSASSLRWILKLFQ